MYVAQLLIDRFRHLEGIAIGPLSAPATSEVVVLAGPNGGGKSSVLELIAWALSSTWGFQWEIRRTFPGSSFEIAFGLSERDLALMDAQVRAEPGNDPNGVLPRLLIERKYYRSFGYPGGTYEQDPAFHNEAHRLVTGLLSNRIKGLFLRSDRAYARRNYDRGRYFDYRRRMTPEYLRSMAFVLTESQYTDQMDFLVEQAYSYPRAVGMHTLAVEAGTDAGPRPADPLAPYDALFQRLFPDYRLAHETDELRDQLYVTLPTGQEVPFSDLSSGEQEVFFVLTFFLRHEIQDSMVFVDEPEMHLHPELVRRMVRTMLSIQRGNQVWLGTHNAEVIDEAGRDRTFFLTRTTPGGPVQAVRASDEEGAIELLRTMFGFSGYVGMARKLVFLEGDDASADRRSFIQMFPAVADEIRFVPINSADNALRINRTVLAILGQTVGHSQFYLVRDRDYLSDGQIASYEAGAGGRLFVLGRHEIENYLLNADSLSEVVGDITGTAASPAEMEALLVEVVRSLAGQVLKDLVASRIGQAFGAQDSSIGGFEQNSQWLDGSNSWDATILAGAKNRFSTRVVDNVADVQQKTEASTIEALFDAAADEVRISVSSGTWRSTFPGKEIIERVGRRLSLPRGPVLANALIRNIAANPARIDRDLVDIVEAIVEHPLT
jgi:ABC-type transport system involved in cytochrome c biogenesis ATPase subunit